MDETLQKATQPMTDHGTTSVRSGGRRLQGPRSRPPLLSIVTVVFNGVSILGRTIDSVLAHPLEAVEYVVIDGGSTDGTLELLRQFDGQIDCWISERDDGIYDAMNKALDLCLGEYVYFLNAGDWMEAPPAPTAVLHVLELKPSLLMARVNAIGRGGQRALFPRRLGLSSARDKFESAYCHQAAFARTGLLKPAGFDRRFKHFADFEALARISAAAPNVIECTLVVANFPLDGVSSDWQRAPALFLEKEHLLSSLGEPRGRLRVFFGLLRAHLYRAKVALVTLLK